jgi:hypothetical protein
MQGADFLNGKYVSQSPDPYDWSEDLTPLQNLLHPHAEENLRVSVYASPFMFLGPGKPHQEPPLWARVNLHKQPPPVWLGCPPFPAKKYPVLFEILERAGLYFSITLLLQEPQSHSHS